MTGTGQDHGVTRATVLGAGTMGPSIVAALAAAGIDTTLWARRPEAAADGAALATQLGDQLVDAGLASAPAAVQWHEDLAEAVDGTDLVVEAISEDADRKADLFHRLEPLVGADIPIASTTSGLAVESFIRGCTVPARFLVLHFWNPAHLIPLVEVLGGDQTPEALLRRAEALVRALGKRPVRLRHFVPGFLGTRLQQAVVREAIALFEAGVADAADIDAATRLSFGARFPVLGPLQTSDVGGLEVVAAIHEYLLADLDTSTTPQRALTDRVARGDLGVRTGRGFYDWTEEEADALRAERDAELISRLHHLRRTGELLTPAAIRTDESAP